MNTQNTNQTANTSFNTQTTFYSQNTEQQLIANQIPTINLQNMQFNNPNTQPQYFNPNLQFHVMNVLPQNYQLNNPHIQQSNNVVSSILQTYYTDSYVQPLPCVKHVQEPIPPQNHTCR